MLANIPTPRQFIDLFANYEVDDPMPFDWERFWKTALETIGCGPTTVLWIVGEGALEDMIDVTIFYEDGGKFGEVLIFGDPNDPVAAWGWELTPLRNARKKADCLWAILPSKRGIRVRNTRCVHDLAKKFAAFDRMTPGKIDEWNRARSARHKAEQEPYILNFKEALRTLDANVVPIADLSKNYEWEIRVDAQPSFNILRDAAESIRKQEKIEIRYPRSMAANPKIAIFHVRLNRKLVRLFQRAGKISNHESVALV